MIEKQLGRYHIIEEIGKGGMAVVYRAEQKLGDLTRTVAIKVLPPAFGNKPRSVQRFDQEARLVAGLVHPHILRVFEFGHLDDIYFIAMNFMPGGTLSERIDEGKIELSQAVEWVEQISQALDYLHAKGLIHRDIKPSNILLDDLGNAYLADFGIARLAEDRMDLTGTAAIGTPSYMAPEMFEYGAPTFAVDIYALGAMLYTLLAGEPPFKGETHQLMHAHLYEPPPDITRVRHDVPASVTNVIRRAMAKQPGRRFSSAGALAEALRQAAGGHAIEFSEQDVLEGVLPPRSASLEAPTIDEQLTSVSRPRKLLPILIMGVGLILAAATFLAFRLNFLPAKASTVPAASTPIGSHTMTSLAASPTPLPLPTATLPLVESAPSLPDPIQLAFNASGNGYLVDTRCLMEPYDGCDSGARSFEGASGEAIPFGEWSPAGDSFTYGDADQVYRYNIETGTSFTILEGVSTEMDWSPQNQLLFIRVQEEAGLGTVANLWVSPVECIESGTCLEQASQITQESRNIRWAEWSPDGDSILFLQEQPSSFLLPFLLDPVSGDILELAPLATSVLSAQWLPDGSGVLFINEVTQTGATSSTRQHSIALNWISLDDINPIKLLDISTGDFGSDCSAAVCPGGAQYAISPDGNTLALTIFEDSTVDSELYLLDLACLEEPTSCATQLEQVSDNAIDEFYPSWSNDGRWLAYISARSTNFNSGILSDTRAIGTDIFVLDIATRSTTQITRLGFVDFFEPSWRP